MCAVIEENAQTGLRGFIRDLLNAGDWVAGDISQDELTRLLIVHGLAERRQEGQVCLTKDLLEFLGDDNLRTWERQFYGKAPGS